MPHPTFMCLSITSRNSDSTTSLWQTVPMLDNLSVKKYFLIYDLNLPWPNWCLFYLFLSLVTWENRLTFTWLHSVFRKLERIRSTSLSLFSRLNDPNSLSCSQYNLCSRSFTGSISLPRTHSSITLFSCSEEHKTGHRIWGAAPPVLCTGGKFLSWSCWPTLLLT